jgi:hypothetical protein
MRLDVGDYGFERSDSFCARDFCIELNQHRCVFLVVFVDIALANLARVKVAEFWVNDVRVIRLEGDFPSAQFEVIVVVVVAQIELVILLHMVVSFYAGVDLAKRGASVPAIGTKLFR